ncbi:MAG: hypothetical protein QXO21_00090 [Candidatus Anstonellales archaeon]
MSSLDFRALQIDTSQIRASGSNGTSARLLIYDISADNAALPYRGQIDLTKFDTTNIGSDVFLFVSGNKHNISDTTLSNQTLFGGSVVISGSLKTYNDFLVKSVIYLDTVKDGLPTNAIIQYGTSTTWNNLISYNNSSNTINIANSSVAGVTGFGNWSFNNNVTVGGNFYVNGTVEAIINPPTTLQNGFSVNGGIVTITPAITGSNGLFSGGDIVIDQGKYYGFRRTADGVYLPVLSLNSSNDLNFGYSGMGGLFVTSSNVYVSSSIIVSGNVQASRLILTNSGSLTNQSLYWSSSLWGIYTADPSDIYNARFYITYNNQNVAVFAGAAHMYLEYMWARAFGGGTIGGRNDASPMQFIPGVLTTDNGLLIQGSPYTRTTSFGTSQTAIKASLNYQPGSYYPNATAIKFIGFSNDVTIDYNNGITGTPGYTLMELKVKHSGSVPNTINNLALQVMLNNTPTFSILSDGKLRNQNSANETTTATAGTATLPANPVGFLSFYDSAGNLRKIPYYAD